MTFRFPITRISNPFLPLTKIRFHFLMKVALLYKSSQTPPIEVYVDTGSPWCIFDGQIAQELGIKDYRDTNLENAWKVETEIGFPALLGIYGFLDRFSFKSNVPEGYFEIEPIFE